MQHPGAVRFEGDEPERIFEARLMLCGVSYSDLERMPDQLKHDVLALKDAQTHLFFWRWAKMFKAMFASRKRRRR